MDAQILRDLFGNCVKAAGINGDRAFAEILTKAIDRLPPTRIGKGGQVQEWLEDWDARRAPTGAPAHLALVRPVPEQPDRPAHDARTGQGRQVTLDTRGDITTGWAIAWRINCWARLRDGERAHKIIKLLLDPSRTYNNLFDAHPPFQIDGNFGGTSGMTELPAAKPPRRDPPAAGPAERVADGLGHGLRARGGFTVDGRLGGRQVEVRRHRRQSRAGRDDPPRRSRVEHAPPGGRDTATGRANRQ
jgi:alpha-L-fucosidase 2